MQKPKHIIILTPLRGLAALLVVLYHYADVYFPNLHPENITPALSKGYLAVDLFFLLSGFVITHAYRDAFAARVTARDYLDFLKARIARLYPLHLTVLALFVAATLARMGLGYALTGNFTPMPLQGGRSVEAIGANLLMLQGFHASTLGWNYHAWSLSLEFTAYLLFPFLLPPLWRAGAVANAAVAVIMAGIVVFVAVEQQGNLGVWDGPMALLRCVPQFMLGALLHQVWRSGWERQFWQRDIALGAALLVTALALHLGAPDLVFPPLALVVILAGAHNEGRLGRFVASRPLVWLGEVSFSLYLLHGLVQYVTGGVLELGLGTRDRSAIPAGWSFVLMAGMLAMSLVLADISYRRVEIAGRRLLRRWLEVPSGLAFAGGGRLPATVREAAARTRSGRCRATPGFAAAVPAPAWRQETRLPARSMAGIQAPAAALHVPAERLGLPTPTPWRATPERREC